MTDASEVAAAVDLLRVRTTADAEFLAAAEAIIAELKGLGSTP